MKKVFCIIVSVLFATWAMAGTQDTTFVFKDTLALTATPQLPAAAYLYFLSPLYNLPVMKPIKLDFAIDPLLRPNQYDEDLYLRQTLAVQRMGQQVVGNLRDEQQKMRVNAGLSMAVGAFFWGMLIEENIRGYINYQQQQKEQQQAPQPNPARPPELNPRR